MFGRRALNRDFIYADDVAMGMITCMEKGILSLNLASGGGVSIKEIAETVGSFTSKEIVWDKDKPSGDKKRVLSTDSVLWYCCQD